MAKSASCIIHTAVLFTHASVERKAKEIMQKNNLLNDVRHHSIEKKNYRTEGKERHYLNYDLVTASCWNPTRTDRLIHKTTPEDAKHPFNCAAYSANLTPRDVWKDWSMR